jgi:hypothetical protein
MERPRAIALSQPVVSPRMRVSDLERWRKGPLPRGGGPTIIAALDPVAEIQGLGLAGLGAEAAGGWAGQVRDDRGGLADPPPP